MNPFEGGPFGGMLAGLKQKALDAKAKASRTRVAGNAGGLVTVTMSCDYQIVSVEIDERCLTDKDMLEDLVRAAMADALSQVQSNAATSLKELTGGLPIPPGLIPGL